MNRIELPELKLSISSSSPGLSSWADAAALRRDRVRDLEVAPYATFAPIHYEPGYAYPLVVWLHGPLGNERQLYDVMPLVSMRNYVAIAPRGTGDAHARRSSFAWLDTADGVEEAESRVIDCVSAAQRRFNIHEQRILVAGLGHGGTMALRVAWNNPGKFAGAATFGGPVPRRNQPLRHVNRMRQLPCLLVTGRDSRDYLAEEVCRDLRLLHAAGRTGSVRQFPCRDELTTNMLADFDRWMMDLVCAPPA